MNDRVYLATYDSRNFQFDAIGESEGEARQALIQGMREHARQYRMAPSVYQGDTDWFAAEDIQIRAMMLGSCYRDREEI